MANDNLENNVNGDVAVVAKKARKSPDLKDKKVTFELSKEMRLADLTKKTGYQRREVELLFAELHAAGIGVHEKGRLGRGQSGKFTCNDDNFPKTYTVTIPVRRLRTVYVGKTVAAPAPVVEAPPVVEAAPAPVVEEAPAADSVIMDAKDSWLTNDGENPLAVAPADVQEEDEVEVEEPDPEATVQ